MLGQVVLLKRVQEKLSQEQEQQNRQVQLMLILLTLAVLALAAAGLYGTRRDFIRPIHLLAEEANQIAKGRLDVHFDLNQNTDLQLISNSLKNITGNLVKATDFAVSVGEGRFDNAFAQASEEDALGKALVEMRNRLQQVAREEGIRNWTINGVAKFSEILRKHQHSSLEELSYEFIRELVKYLGANQGGLYIIDYETEKEPFIELKGVYAYERRKHINRRFAIHEGLPGQCVRERDHIYLEEIPKDYVEITSGLGQATPRNVLMVPAMVNEEIHGAIELASFQQFEPHHIDFVRSIGQTLASTLSGVKLSERTKMLLEQARASNQVLQEKEEQMRQNAEELTATQEELNRKLSELEVETNLSKRIIEAINKTNASVEFDMQGNILEVNEMYISVMGYTRAELVGKNERKLVPNDEITSSRYQLLWDSLHEGSFISGEYRRLNKQGKEVWLNGTYNPILDVNGHPYKVIQFAQFTTEEKEKDLDLTSKINALSAFFPLLDLDLGGSIKTSNQSFVDLFQYKRLELRKKAIIDLVRTSHAEEMSGLLRHARNDETASACLPLQSKEGLLHHCLVIVSPIKNLIGEVSKLMMILIDVSEQKNLENELRTRIAMLNKAACIFEMDQNGRILQANPPMSRFLMAQEELQGKNIFEYTSETFRINAQVNLWSVMERGGIFRGKVKFFTERSSEIWGDLTVAPVMDSGKAVRFVVIVIDVSKQVEMEEQLRRRLAQERMKNAIFRLGEGGSGQVMDVLVKTLGDQGMDDFSLERVLRKLVRDFRSVVFVQP
ncbi:MAG: PAS domain S-box protein [Cytophagales bacterium]|nr:PAS domain S-box protein [Cytophagales bacterium]